MPARTPKKRISNDLLAFQDPDFLMREEMRASRIALEFAKAELGLIDQGIKSTVVVFGSSRARPVGQTRTRAGRAQTRRTAKAILGAEELAAWYTQAREFGRIVSERGGALSPLNGVHENVIATGGGPGIMEAANRGAADVGAPTIGYNITLPAEQHPNKYITEGLSFHFHYFAIRKMHFAMRANALAIFPGGFGTLDELFEILTLKQTRKTAGMPVILFCRSFWTDIVNFEALANLGTIDKADLALFRIVDNAEEGWQAMVEHGLTTPTPLREA